MEMGQCESSHRSFYLALELCFGIQDVQCKSMHVGILKVPFSPFISIVFPFALLSCAAKRTSVS